MAKLKCVRPMLRCADVSAARLPPKVADSLYSTPEFKAWRDAVIRRAGNRCESPRCGRAGVRLFADHIHEVKDGGAKFDLANGMALCGACHSLKTARVRAERLSRAR